MNRRERVRGQTREEIKAHARRQMTEQGTAAVSLGAIARAMGMTTPGLYRYYSDRDALITALIVDAFEDLAATLQAAVAAIPSAQYADRLLAAVLAYRGWALAHPVDFQLVFGNPIPGYSAPSEVTVPAVRDAFTVLVGVMHEAYAAGVLTPSPAHLRVIETWRLPPFDDSMAYPFRLVPVVVYLAAVGWTRMHGIVTLELFHHIQSLVGATDAFYRQEMLGFMREMGLTPSDTS